MINHETGAPIQSRAELTEAQAREAGKAKVEKSGVAVAMVPLDASTGQAVLCYPTSTGARSRPLAKTPTGTASVAAKPAKATPKPVPLNHAHEEERAFLRAAVNIGLYRAQDLLVEIREKLRA